MNKAKQAIATLGAALGLLLILTFNLDAIAEWFEKHAGGLILARAGLKLSLICRVNQKKNCQSLSVSHQKTLLPV